MGETALLLAREQRALIVDMKKAGGGRRRNGVDSAIFDL